MTELQKLEVWGESELSKIFKETPAIVKQYGSEVITILNTVKKAVASPQGEAVQAVLATLFPGTWEIETVNILTTAIGKAIPELTDLVNGGGTFLQDVESLVTYIQGLKPAWKTAGFFKLASLIFRAIDPSLSEVETDTSAQVAYATSIAA